jgi:deoxyribose-phosphate aldolase
MSNEMIQKITEEVMRKLDQDNLSSARQTNQNLQTSNKKINYKISSGNSALILLCGGNREIEEVMRQIEIISKTYTNTYIVMTRAAIKIIGMPDVRKVSEGATIITEYSEEYFDNILGRIDVIYVPILSLNTAAKVAALNADSLGTITMVFGLMYGKPVIAAQDSIYCCQIEKDQVPPAMNRKIDGVIDQLTSMGIRMVNVHNLSDQEPSPYTPTTSSRSYTIGTAGKDIGVDGKSQVAVKALVNGGATRITSETGINGYDIDLAQHIDHTNLRADATDEETPTVKAIETRDAIANGAEEVDMVINVGALKSGNDDLVRQDIQAVVNAAAGKAIVKVILETALLTKEQIVKGSLLTKLSGADFVKTSTGFSTAGALVEDIALMRKTVGPEMGVKAAGGIRTHEIAEQMINAGATRIGASASIAIVKGTDSKTGTY